MGASTSTIATGDVRAKKEAIRLFFGRTSELSLPVRLVTLLFVITAIASMSFTQLGFWPIGVVDGKPVYLMLILAPLVMGALIFGPVTGLLLGLFTGVVLFAHASLFPLDFYEIYFMIPLNTFVLFQVITSARVTLTGPAISLSLCSASALA